MSTIDLKLYRYTQNLIIQSWYPREIDTVIAWHDMTSLLSWGGPTLLLVPETRAFAWNNLNIIQTKLTIQFFIFTNMSWNDAVMIWHTVHWSRFSLYNSSWHSRYSLYRKILFAILKTDTQSMCVSIFKQFPSLFALRHLFIWKKTVLSYSRLKTIRFPIQFLLTQ